MRNTEKRELTLKIKRLGLFMCLVLVPALVICVLLIWAKVPQWLNIMVLVICLFVLYAFYLLICGYFDKRKEERLSKKKDPFSE